MYICKLDANFQKKDPKNVYNVLCVTEALTVVEVLSTYLLFAGFRGVTTRILWDPESENEGVLKAWSTKILEMNQRKCAQTFIA